MTLRLAWVGWAAVCVLFPSTARAQYRVGSQEITQDTRIEGRREKPQGPRVVVLGRDSVVRVKSPLEHPITLTIDTDVLVVEPNVVIDGQGQQGAPGAPGADRGDQWTSGGAFDATREWEAAGSEVDRGGAGGPGNPGGPGATLIIHYDSRVEGAQNLRVLVGGGAGGSGGPGGRGRLLINGADGRRKYGPQGFSGPPGTPGPAGRFEMADMGPAPVPYSVTISGGVSEGAYEAGYNWAFLKHLKAHRPDVERPPGAPPATFLAAASGASAGTINAILSAVAWCQDDTADHADSAEDNLFRDAWLPVGMSSLLPAPRESCEDYRKRAEDPDAVDCSQSKQAYLPDDGLLTRRALKAVEKKLASRIAEGHFRRCNIPIGFTLTKKHPETLVGGAQIPFARTAVVLSAKADGPGPLRFVDATRGEDEVARYLHARGQGGTREVAFSDVLDLIEASSAFPFAFGPKAIPHCVSAGATGPGCPKDEAIVSDLFLDGGVYDNVPLGLANSLLALQDGAASSSTTRFLLVDPDARRHWPLSAELERERRGLSNLQSFVGDFVSIARKYENQALFRYRLGVRSEHPAPPITFSSRYMPIFGENLAGFGAFFARLFREYDYYVGVYDALYDRARSECQWAHRDDGTLTDSEQEAGCYARRLALAANVIEAGPTPGTAGSLIRALLDEELQTWLDVGARARVLDGDIGNGLSLRAWLANKAVPSRYEALVRIQARWAADWTLAARSGHDGVDKFNAEHSFAKLVESVSDALGQDQSVGSSDRRYLLAPLWETDDALLKLAARLNDVEEADQSKSGKQIADSAEFAISSEIAVRSHGLDLDPSSIPDRDITWARGFAHAAPFQVVGSSRVLDVGWRPTYAVHRRLALVVPLSPLEVENRVGGFHVGGGLLLRPFSNVFGFVLPGFEASVRYSHTWRAMDDGAIGAEFAVYLLGNNLRVGASLRDVTQTPAWSNVRLTFGVANFNGLLYWLTRLF
ncbi:MAG: patatin-like phospholipase family protein [Deltaproteobacteria bacterium]|nr:patatin-like phospholipase family protein [Deltaproteobacteria bacterium]